MIKIIYLASGEGIIDLPGVQVTYNDIKVQRDLVCDMLDVDLSDYDILLASPPCNYYSKANYRRDTSVYSLATRYLLPCIIYKFSISGKPFIIENVINKSLMKTIINSLPQGVTYNEAGRHCYFTNIDFDFKSLVISKDIAVDRVCSKKRQGSGGVNMVFEKVIESVIDKIAFEKVIKSVINM